jgi:hypothetical protein
MAAPHCTLLIKRETLSRFPAQCTPCPYLHDPYRRPRNLQWETVVLQPPKTEAHYRHVPVDCTDKKMTATIIVTTSRRGLLMTEALLLCFSRDAS